MNKKREAGSPVTDDTEQKIKTYLYAHPDFFTQHLDLLEILRVPHPCRPAVSLLERQLILLREQNTQLRKKLQELLDVARDNDSLSRRMQCLTLELIEAAGLDEMIQGIQSVLRDKFNADFTALRLAAQPAEVGLAQEPEFVSREALILFEPLLRGGRPLCGYISHEQAKFLFNEATPQVKSVALVPLRGVDWQGVLAVGSRTRSRFYPGMGTLFLSRMGELITHALQPHLRPLSDRVSS